MTSSSSVARGIRILFFAGLLAVLPRGALSAVAQKDPPQDAAVVRLGAVEGSRIGFVKGLGSMATGIQKGSGGRLKVELLTGGATGTEADLLKDIIQGRLQGGFVSATIMAHSLPAFRMLLLPRLFNDYAQVAKFTGSALDHSLRQTASRKQLQVLGYASYGFYGLLDFSRASPRILTDLMVRVPKDAWLERAYQAMGFTAHYVPADDLSTALGSQWVTGVAATPEMLANTSLPKQAPRFHATRHLHGWTVLVVNLPWLEGLPDDLRKVVTDAGVGVTRSALGQAQTREEQILAQWSQTGSPVVIPPPTPSDEPPDPALRALIQEETPAIEQALQQQQGLLIQLWDQRQDQPPIPAPLSSQPLP
ncbi:MAG: TRAP transporter substrate-binding protein DctP [Magnetococcales bacterium]|nr:TRAP transporter substrate-binding protein DctP [Magnetococcales bacterium]